MATNFNTISCFDYYLCNFRMFAKEYSQYRAQASNQSIYVSQPFNFMIGTSHEKTVMAFCSPRRRRLPCEERFLGRPMFQRANK